MGKHIVCTLVLALVGSISLPVLSASGSGDSAQRMEALVGTWVSTERQIDQLQHSWQQQELVLQQRLELLKLEQKSLQKQLDKHSGAQNKTQQYRAELAEEQTRLEQEQQVVVEALAQLSFVVEALLPRLPEPLANHWLTTLNKLQAVDGEASSSQRLDVYLLLMKSFDEFQQKVTRHQSLMMIDGKEVLVDQVYLGVGHGWYLSRNGEYAGMGWAGDSAWVWQADNTLAGELQQVLATLDDPQQAQMHAITVDLTRGAQP